MEEVVVYDCAWIEECFLRGKVIELEGWVVWPWQYAGSPEWIPLELFDGLPEMEEASMNQKEEDLQATRKGWGAKGKYGDPFRKNQVSHPYVIP